MTWEKHIFCQRRTILGTAMPELGKASGRRTAPRRSSSGPIPVISYNDATQDASASLDTESPAPDSHVSGNYLLLITLNGIEDPKIQRLLTVPCNFTLARMNKVLQAAFGWKNSPFHRYDIFATPDSTEPSYAFSQSLRLLKTITNDARQAETTLSDVYERPGWKDMIRVRYEYGFPQPWVHDIGLLGRATSTTCDQALGHAGFQVMCLAGVVARADEERSGPRGWEGDPHEFSTDSVNTTLGMTGAWE